MENKYKNIMVRREVKGRKVEVEESTGSPSISMAE